ncbi:hypothetical protein [Longispora albida]|nr:hypothetical protein [Longispora albida]
MDAAPTHMTAPARNMAAVPGRSSSQHRPATAAISADIANMIMAAEAA